MCWRNMGLLAEIQLAFHSSYHVSNIRLKEFFFIYFELTYHNIATHTINESAPEFKLCIDDILHRIKNMGPVVDSNEAMRCEYISTILHTAVSLLKDLLILPQMTVTGAESSGRVDYAIKKIIDGLF